MTHDDSAGPPAEECLLCRPAEADGFFERRRVWEDEHWRLSVVLRGAVAGFAHLEPRRHIPYITDLAGPEAATLGPVLARATAAVREATGPTRSTCTSSATGCRTCTSTWPRAIRAARWSAARARCGPVPRSSTGVCTRPLRLRCAGCSAGERAPAG
ncbi:HIT family protein [Catellatospora coxensis]